MARCKRMPIGTCWSSVDKSVSVVAILSCKLLHHGPKKTCPFTCNYNYVNLQPIFTHFMSCLQELMPYLATTKCFFRFHPNRVLLLLEKLESTLHKQHTLINQSSIFSLIEEIAPYFLQSTSLLYQGGDLPLPRTRIQSLLYLTLCTTTCVFKIAFITLTKFISSISQPSNVM